MPVTGLAKIIRSRTAQEKNDDSDSRYRRTDDSASPLLTRLTSARLRTALAAARHPDRSAATALLAQAEDAAGRLGRDANYWQTAFGPTNVRLHRVAASLDLGDVAWVIERGPGSTRRTCHPSGGFAPDHLEGA